MLEKKTHDLARLGALRVVGIWRGVEYGCFDKILLTENINRWNRQLPTAIAIHERQVHERTLINFLLILGHLIDQTKLPRNSISFVTQEWKLQMVLVGHQVTLVNCVRRDRYNRFFQ